jgi:hypothetical protein
MLAGEAGAAKKWARTLGYSCHIVPALKRKGDTGHNSGGLMILWKKLKGKKIQFLSIKHTIAHRQCIGQLILCDNKTRNLIPTYAYAEDPGINKLQELKGTYFSNPCQIN